MPLLVTWNTLDFILLTEVVGYNYQCEAPTRMGPDQLPRTPMVESTSQGVAAEGAGVG